MNVVAGAMRMFWSGIGRVPGESSASQASVQGVRSMRAGFPVYDLDRTVSLDVAFR